MSQLSNKQIKKLQALLKSERGLDYDSQQAQMEGLKIMRVTLAKLRRNNSPTLIKVLEGLIDEITNDDATASPHDVTGGTEKSRHHHAQLH